MADGIFQHTDALEEREVVKGVHFRILVGSRLMFSIVRFEPHATVPTHQHPHEQLGIILDGELEMWIGDTRRHLRRGDLYAIPPNLPHGAQTQGTVALVLDAFHPLREEYVKLFSSSAG